jgi:tRNA 2-thiouridine synthesizing protein E
MSNYAEIMRDSEGYIVDPEDWNETLAEQLAQEEGLALDERFWPIIHFMRRYWIEHQIAPDVRHVIKFLSEENALDKKQAKQQIFELFPYGYVKQACKIAGMKKPRVWSTG